ncbi:condensation domain-containing protein [Streptomyces megasporus]|uniref:condensation domain-containing protein n=1 Tax=Streptomyces megasporus TaxID=44060 RepID=UPI0006921498|nr:condensation domain-containing protein [Streptomyces megasporus]
MTSTLVELLRGRAMSSSDGTAFRFLSDDTTAESVTYGELDRDARAVAVRLRELGAVAGDRALLLYPPGLDYIRAFFGAVYAGVVPVPAYPPRTQRNVHRLTSIVADSRAGFALTTASVLELLREDGEEHGPKGLRIAVTDRLDTGAADDWSAPRSGADSTAFIQYTSGSTASPKGVVLTHGNLLHNLGMISRAFGCHERTSAVIWLPPYHDMGLIGGILTPLYAGFPVALMAPMSFLRRPMHWLRVVSEERAEFSGAPNFAYEMCARLATDEDRRELDLSSWRVAFNGAEPIRAATLDAFAEAFADCGFRRESFLPCYGLAEATLFVTGASASTEPTVVEVDAAGLEADRAEPAVSGRPSRRLVGSGTPAADQEVLVVDPETRLTLPEQRIGEIWVRGASVAAGYWDNPVSTDEAFGARTADTHQGPFLRTGDLGFLSDGELFVTGRRKDLIIVRGRNFYPTDIEQAVERSHPAFRPGCCAAVAVEHDGEQVLVVLQEVEGRSLRTVSVPEAVAAVREAVMESCELAVHAVVLLKPGTIPKTTSGKVQRALCRERYLSGGFQALGPDTDARDARALPDRTTPSAPPSEPHAVVADALRARIAELLGCAPDEVATDVPLSSLGIDSPAAVLLANRMHDELGVELRLGRMLGDAGIDALAAEARIASAPDGEPDGAEPDGEPGGMSLGQRSIWHVQQQDPTSTAYNIPVALRLLGRVDPQALRRALAQVSERHEVLRTRYRVDGDRTVSFVSPEPIALECLDASADSEDRLAERLADLAHRPFDLEHDPVLRAWLLTRSQDEHVLLLTVHHIAADLWSMVVLLDELGRCHRAHSLGAPADLPAPAGRYADHVRRERSMLAGARGAALEAYWRETLAGPPPVLDLPVDTPHPPVPSHRGERLVFRFDAGQTGRLREFAAAEGVTLYTVLLSAFHIALHHASGQDDVVVGSPAANRGRQDVEGVVGYFTNPLPIRARFEDGLTAREFTGRLHRTVLGALDHQALPLPRILEIAQPRREPGRNPLFQAVFVLQRPHAHADAAAFVLGTADPGATVPWGGLRIAPHPLPHRTAQYELMLTVVDAGTELHAALEYGTDILTAGSATRLADHYRAVLDGLLERPDATVAELCPADPLRRADHGAAEEDHPDGYVAPRTDTERVLAKIWSEVLGVEPVGVEDDFYDLGGHSLLAVQLISAVRDELGVDVPVRSVMQARTVSQSAAVVDALLWARDGARSAGPSAPVTENREEGRL